MLVWMTAQARSLQMSTWTAADAGRTRKVGRAALTREPFHGVAMRTGIGAASGGVHASGSAEASGSGASGSGTNASGPNASGPLSRGRSPSRPTHASTGAGESSATSWVGHPRATNEVATVPSVAATKRDEFMRASLLTLGEEPTGSLGQCPRSATSGSHRSRAATASPPPCPARMPHAHASQTRAHLASHRGAACRANRPRPRGHRRAC